MERKENSEVPDIVSLLFELSEGQLDPESEQQLRKLLAGNDEALQRYVEYMHLSTEMIDWARRDDSVQMLEDLLDDLHKQSSEESKVVTSSSSTFKCGVEPLTHQNHHWRGWSHRFLVETAIAACLLVSGLFYLLMPADNAEDGQLASNPPSEHVDEKPLPASTESYVARIEEATQDVTWAKNSAPVDLMLRLKQGEQIAIESGVLQIRYFTGAEVILHGPATFMPTGKASGHLAAGRMTGKVADSKEKDFRLTTPKAEVIDLGTVFGVAVNDLVDTDVYVFDGEVEVTSTADSSSPGKPIRLQEGMSLRLSGNGQADMSAEIDRSQFLDQMPQHFGNQLKSHEISLIDAFIDGPGLSHRLVATLDPNTGKPDEDPLRERRNTSGNGFRRAVYSEFVDGVIIPKRSGKDIQVDSYGKLVDLPQSVGFTYGSIWARRPLPGLSFNPVMVVDEVTEAWQIGATQKSFEKLGQCRLGMIGLQPNVGLTFDLDAIQSVEGQAVERFRCAIADLGPPANGRFLLTRSMTGEIDVRIYLDGVERHSQLGLSREAGEVLIDTRIDRFSTTLTIVATIASGGNEYHQLVILDPTLEMAY